MATVLIGCHYKLASSIFVVKKRLLMYVRRQALLAVMAGFYAIFHGPKGLRAIAQRIHRKTTRLARGLEGAGFEVGPKEFF